MMLHQCQPLDVLFWGWKIRQIVMGSPLELAQHLLFPLPSVAQAAVDSSADTLCLRLQRPIMRDYVTLTGPPDGATAAGVANVAYAPQAHQGAAATQFSNSTATGTSPAGTSSVVLVNRDF